MQLLEKEIIDQLKEINKNLEKINNVLLPPSKPKITINKKELMGLVNQHKEEMEDDERRLKDLTLWQKFTGYTPDDIDVW